MTAQEAILAFVNRQLPKYAAYRSLLAHGEWIVPRPEKATLPTIMVHDTAMTPSIFAFSSEGAYQAACKALNEKAIGPVVRLKNLDDVVIEDDARVQRLQIDFHSPISFSIQTDELAVFRRLARSVRVERAMTERNYAEVRKFDRYGVPYFGVLGQGHNLITLPSPRGQMLAAFTAADAIDAFLAAGSDENRAKVQFAVIDGSQLFGVVEQVAKGVLMNPMGPRTFGFELDVCRDVMAAV
jgi:hypothetical protein